MKRSMHPPLEKKLMNVFGRLYSRYGPQHWWPGDGAFEVIIGAILTQGTSWTNVDKALVNLKAKAILEPAALRNVEDGELGNLIKPSVYFNAKTKKVKAFSQHLGDIYGDNLKFLLEKDSYDLRQELLSIYGIGEETADDIILYAARKPVFVIDTYTRRILDRLDIGPTADTYASYQAVFMDNLPHDVDLFNEYHALLDRHGSETCFRRRPDCSGCCLLDICPTGALINQEP